MSQCSAPDQRINGWATGVAIEIKTGISQRAEAAWCGNKYQDKSTHGDKKWEWQWVEDKNRSL